MATTAERWINRSFSLSEFARMARRDRKTVTRWIQRGVIRARTVQGRYQFDEREVRRVLDLSPDDPFPNVIAPQREPSPANR